MSSDISIAVSNLAKCYKMFARPSDRLLQIMHLKSGSSCNEFWALKNINFNVKKGSTVGIVGRNGSGKSTLLQIIAGTLLPSSGTVDVFGKVAALLELGSGFNPEFSGKENVYLNAAVLGLTSKETKEIYEKIVDFAEIPDFIDQPVKTYSSGMMIRLAFSVAIHTNPEVLIIDEALSVGDELFQRKCFSKIEEIKKSGATILFVSHSGSTVVELCDEAILIDAGEMVCSGSPKFVVSSYQKLLYTSPHLRQKVLGEISKASESPVELSPVLLKCQPIGEHVSEMHDFYAPDLQSKSSFPYESNGAYIVEAFLLNKSGERVNHLIRGRYYELCYEVHFTSDAKNIRFSTLIKTTSGLELGGSVSCPISSREENSFQSGEKVIVRFGFNCLLNPGTYFFNAGVLDMSQAESVYMHRVIDIYLFKVQPVEDNTSTSIVDFNFKFLK